MKTDSSCIAFAGTTCIASGDLPEVARAVRIRLDEEGPTTPVILDARTSRPIDLDLRGTPGEVAARAEAMLAEKEAAEEQTGPGRPRLGVVGREVTLLPEHWDWLNAQRGGASATLRRLVHEARRQDQGDEKVREAQDAAYRFMTALGGDLPGYEEAIRALYAWELERLEDLMSDWPPDVREHTLRLVRRAG